MPVSPYRDPPCKGASAHVSKTRIRVKLPEMCSLLRCGRKLQAVFLGNICRSSRHIPHLLGKILRFLVSDAALRVVLPALGTFGVETIETEQRFGRSFCRTQPREGGTGAKSRGVMDSNPLGPRFVIAEYMPTILAWAMAFHFG